MWLLFWILSSFPSGAAEGDGYPQVRGVVHQSEQCRLPPISARLWGGVGVEGWTERNERMLGSARYLPGGLEGRATEGADAVPGTKKTLQKSGKVIGILILSDVNYVSFLSGIPRDEPRPAALAGEHRPQEERGGAHPSQTGSWNITSSSQNTDSMSL